MGQAKRRGSFEDRRAQSIARREAELRDAIEARRDEEAERKRKAEEWWASLTEEQQQEELAKYRAKKAARRSTGSMVAFAAMLAAIRATPNRRGWI